MNLALWLARAAKSHANAPAVAIGGRVARNYAELAECASRLAGALRGKFGLQSGERVAIVAYNCVEYVELLYGIWHAGLAAVPINAKLHGAEIGYILEHSAARVCFASGDIETAISAHAPPTLQHLIAIDEAAYKTLFTSDVIDPMPRQAEDLAWLFYTSGTTGRPKGAVLTHRVLAAASYAYAAEVDPIQPGDALIHGAPMSLWLRSLHHGAYHAVRHQRDSRDRRFRSGRDFSTLECMAGKLDVCRAHDDQASGRLPRRLLQ